MSRAPNSSRWCPTPEQLMILEEMYRSGTRTPNAPQIQQITAHLSFYGKIEGKNVFYWFQNHKARDRQKLRRKLYKQLQLQQQQQQQALYHHQHLMMMNHCANPNNNNNINNNNNNIVQGPNNNGFHFLESPLSHNNFHPPLNSLSSSSVGPMLPPQPQMQGRLFEDQYHQAPPNSTTHNHHQLMSNNWKMEIPVDHHHHHQKLEKERMYDRDLMMMMTLDDNVGPEELTSSPTSNNNKPLKTLQLFPVTSTNLKEEALINHQLINMHG